MEKDNGKYVSNVITGRFKSDKFRDETEDDQKKSAKAEIKQTNPLFKRFFKLVHVELSKHDGNYKSFSAFKPDDVK